MTKDPKKITKMRVEMYDRDWSVNWMDWSQQWQNDGMVTTKGNNSRMVISVNRNWKKLLSRDRIIAQGGVCFTLKQALVTVLNLLDCEIIVVWTGRVRVMRSREWEPLVWENLRYRYIAAVDDPQARVKGINFKGDIVSSI